VQATPRHSFVHRYRIDDGPQTTFQARHLADIYSDKIMRHVDQAGALLPSSNSQPSYILFLLHLLDIRQGERVLEIGSGSGWLAAIMAHLTGLDGQVTGIEIIPDLAEQSRLDLAARGLHRVTILTQDGTAGHAPGAPFDRVMITAGAWSLPVALFDQVKDGGVVLLPLVPRGGTEGQVAVLRRAGSRFVAERSVAGWFVPLVGAGQDRENAARDLQDLPLATVRCPLPLGARPGGGGGALAAQFSTFLGRTEPGFAVFEAPVIGSGWQCLSAGSFGLVDQAGRSIALCKDGELLGYGPLAAARRLAAAFERWAAFGLPGMAAFALEVVRRDAAPTGGDRQWIEPRADTALVWRLADDALAWRGLFGGRSV
jgi:protein-L-isoaspartate(D-aspartate) O-methyltransferase